MFKPVLRKPATLAGALLGAGLITCLTGSKLAGEAATDYDALIAGVPNSVCLTGNGAKGKLFYQLAAVKNELKPLGTLPKAGAAPQSALPDDTPPLWNDLGTVAYKISTTKPLAQRYFNQGLRLTYGFNHAEAARAYKTARQLDPECAMCYWGEALVLGPNINLPMDAAAIAPALAAVNQAREKMGHVSPREQALIKALAARYSDDPQAERAVLDAAYADAMGKVAARYPNDQDIAVLYSEALMNLSPWDYWEAGGAKPKGRTAELIATLEKVLRANPNHPGAIHYYIHTVEASTDPKRAEPYAERLGKLMPGAGHIVHMPAHIYYRVGRYKDSLAVNKRAVTIDEAYIAAQHPQGIYPLGYYPHNVHFVLVSAQMAGDGETVIGAADKLSALVSDDTARAFAIAQPVKVAPYYAHAQFSEPETILALPEPGEGLPYVEAMWHYARGVAYAAKNDAGGAGRESAAIDSLLANADFKNLIDAGIPVKEVLRIARYIVDARSAQASGNLTAAVEQFQHAAALEDQLAYMEPPYWYYPVRQSLGAALLAQGDLDGAEQAFRGSLARAPNNGWALYGLAEVYKKRGDEKRAAATEKLLGKAWAGTREQLSMAKL